MPLQLLFADAWTAAALVLLLSLNLDLVVVAAAAAGSGAAVVKLGEYRSCPPRGAYGEVSLGE